VDAARKFTFAVGGIIATVATVLIPIAASARLANLMAGMAILGANMMSNITIAVITDVFPHQAQARVTSLSGVGEGIMNMVMSLATGFLVDHFSFLPVFMAGAGLPVASSLGLFALVRKCQPMPPAEFERQVS
jgi:ACS family hexuronate transporter-like MFS transporter